MKENPIRMVVFDIAGTTVKDAGSVHRSLINAMGRFGYTISMDDANSVMGYPKPFAIQTLLMRKEPDISKITVDFIDLIHSDFVKEMIHFYKTSPTVIPADHAEETFLQLKALGIKVALDTGFSKNITDVIIDRLNWNEYGLIDASISSDEVPRGRPHPDMIHALMKSQNIESVDQVAKVGDTVADLEEGNSAKCRYVIGITTGAYSQAELETTKHTHLISDLSEIIDIVIH